MYIIPQTTYNIIIQISCLMSMIGATIMALSWAYPVANRKKHGRILLLWLSIADFCSSLIYFIQTFSLDAPGKSAFCQITALIGIFFPVASFLWTDAIAYYLYSVIVFSHFYTDVEWTKLLKKFHLGVWGISAVLALIIYIFKRAGRSDVVSNTGGWCWISGDNDVELLTWEIIGGKCVEWLSCFLLLPFFYATAGYKLWTHDNNSVAGSKISNNSASNNQILLNSARSYNNANNNNNSNNEDDKYSIQDNYSINSNSGLHSQVTQEYTSFNNNHNHNNNNSNSNNNNNQKISNQPDVGEQPSVSSRPPARFGKFYRKMAILPIAFFLMRFPGTLRMLTNYLKASRQTNQVLQVLQSIFDPLQGFINALVFVWGSEDGLTQAILSIGFFIKNNLSCISCFDRLADYIISSQLTNTATINRAYRANILNNAVPQNEASESLLYTSESMLSSSNISDATSLSIARNSSNQNLHSEMDHLHEFDD